MLFQKTVLLCFAGSSLARSLQGIPKRFQPRQDPTPTAGAPTAESTACGDIIEAVDDPQGFSFFWAKHAYACLQSVPFNPAVASRFLKYWNETLQFQSTLAYLKNPPAGYQQPAVDVNEELAKIQQRIDTGFYANQYAFEADFQLLLYATHDGHVSLTAGVLSAFSYGSPFEIVSVSPDGKAPPKIYLTSDVIDSQTEGWTPSPIKTINGEDVAEYLTRFAALNSPGYIEPHAEWNAIMSSPALDVQSRQTTFSGAATFYPGDNLTVHFENYTAEDTTTLWDTVWIAVYKEFANYTGPLSTGGDFYNYFVLGQLPASFDPDRIVRPTTFTEPPPAPGNWSDVSFGAYPENPDVAQAELGPIHPGIVSGYFYEDISTGVLSLPSFHAISDSVGNYTIAVADFISKASDAGLKNVIIDLQRNPGGLVLLAYTTFKIFFPDLTPFGGSRRRITPLANALGSVTTDLWELLDEDDEDELAFKLQMSAFEWLITNKINAATGKNFTSWEEYATVVSDNDDTFSQIEQYDLANKVFSTAAFDQWYPTMYVEDERDKWPWTNRHWEPDHITLLTDGTCSSACALFVEMMTRAGVKTIVAGGRPQTGPMQAVGGNRGAKVYGADELDEDMLFAREVGELIEESVNDTVPEIRDRGIYTTHASVNLRDQIRKGETTPLQFKYEAADCRVYFTLANVYNFTRLWHDVAAAAADPSLCVEGSTGFSTKNPSPSPPPAPTAERPTLDQNNPVIEKVEFEADPDGGLRAIDGPPTLPGATIAACVAGLKEGQYCDNVKGGGICTTVDMSKVKCKDGSAPRTLMCLPACNCGPWDCACTGGVCSVGAVLENKAISGVSAGGHMETAKPIGQCFPDIPTKQRLGCPAPVKKKPNKLRQKKPKGQI